MLKHFPEELKKAHTFAAAYGAAIAPLKSEEITTEYFEKHHPELHAAMQFHGGLDQVQMRFKKDLDIRENINERRHADSLVQYEKALGGDEHALDKLIGIYRPVATSIARRTLSNHLRKSKNWNNIEEGDLVNEALTHLAQHYHEYDESQSMYPTFAFGLMTSRIRHYLRDNNDLVRLPAWFMEAKVKVANAMDELLYVKRRRPTMTEIAKQANLSIENVIEVFTHHPTIRLEKLAGDRKEINGHKWLAEPEARQELELLERQIILRKAIRDHVDLSDRQRLALRLFGQGYETADIARLMETKYSLASQYLAVAKKKIRKDLLLRVELGLD